MTDEETQQEIKAQITRYEAAAHAMQAGVATALNKSLDYAGATPKHLRVGVNSAMIETSTIVKLMVDKGLFTWLEWYTALADNMTNEKTTYEKELSELYGTNITLV